MKLKHIFMAAAALVLGSCSKEIVYPKPEAVQAEEVTLTKILSSKAEWVETTRVFTLELGTEGVSGSEGKYSGSGSVLSLTILGNKYYMETATYTATTSDAPRNGCYISDQTSYVRVGGSSDKSSVVDGDLCASSDGKYYYFFGQLKLENETFVKVSAKVELEYPYEKMPEVEVFYEVTEDVSVPDGSSVEVHAFSVKNGEDVLGYFEITTAPGGKVETGDYVSTEYATRDNLTNVLCNGWSFPAWGIGGGSFAVDASGTQQYIGAGEIVKVERKDEKTIIFTWGDIVLKGKLK
ncbi:MAG: hypothetical protein ACI4TU_01760 [Candidatus Cryptobacteroides sp.]